MIDLFSQQLKKSETAVSAKVESDAHAEKVEMAKETPSSESTSPVHESPAPIDSQDEVEEASRSLQEVKPMRPSSRLTGSKFVNNATQSDSTRLAVLIERFVESSKLDGKYFLCDHAQLVLVSNWLHSVPLTLSERYVCTYTSSMQSQYSETFSNQCIYASTIIHAVELLILPVR